MSDDRVEKANRFARLVYIAVGSTLAGLFALWLAFGLLQETAFAFVANAILWLWLAIFFSVPVLAIAWLVRFGSLVSTAGELRMTRIVMAALPLISVILVAGFIALLVIMVRGLINFL